jgi:hypothetical protein
MDRFWVFFRLGKIFFISGFQTGQNCLIVLLAEEPDSPDGTRPTGSGGVSVGDSVGDSSCEPLRPMGQAHRGVFLSANSPPVGSPDKAIGAYSCWHHWRETSELLAAARSFANSSATSFANSLSRSSAALVENATVCSKNFVVLGHALFPQNR